LTQPVPRIEDDRLLRGKGCFVDDLHFEGQAFAYMLRSPHAHARILSIDIVQASAHPGVLAIITGSDVSKAGLGPLPCRAPVKSRDGSPMRAPARPLLSMDRVRYVGDGIAVVVAESVADARAAAELIEVDYEELEPQIDLATEGELCFDWEKGDGEAVEAAFARAHKRVRIRAVNNRIVVSPIETRGAIGVYDKGSDHYTLYTQTQGAHLIRTVIGESVLKLGSKQLRVITNDVGGSFGMKLVAYPEQALVLFAAKKSGRPVKWIGDRGDAFLTDAHGRDHVGEAEVALDGHGKFLAMRAHIRANLGAYLSTLGPMIPTDALAKVFGYVYDVPALYIRVEGILTHTTPLDAYRGAGKPEINYLVERLIEKAARETDIDRIDLRRRNLISPRAMPYTNALGFTWDVGEFERVLDRGLMLSGWKDFEARRRTSTARGKKRGIGLGLYLHATGGSPTEVSQVELMPDKTVVVRTGTQSSGQGHETAFAQIVSQRLEIPIDRVRVVQGDSDAIAVGSGTGGSSSLPIGATTIRRAAGHMLEEANVLAADALEAAAADLEYGAGTFRIPGTDISIGLFDLADRLQSEMGRGCLGEAKFEGENLTCPNGVYVCEVEIDPETGAVRVVRYTAVDDLGVVLHPQIAEGQIHGGLAQALGQALLECAVYEPGSGQLLSGSFMDYGLPRADDIPAFEGERVGRPSRNNPLGMKGAGEAGTIGGCAPVINAIANALGHDDIDMPATPERVWRALHHRG
jgi:carbon-monoxide dehydrogenase large subunit